MRYAINGATYTEDDPGLTAALRAMYARQGRPLCCCKSPGIEMYIARVGEDLIIKRMPNSGFRHAANCESFDPPAQISGLGELLGAAIQRNHADGSTNLKLDFAMVHRGASTSTAASEFTRSDVCADGKRLTLRGLLHFLLDEAGLSRWSPAMKGKRNWWVVRKYLIEAAVGKTAGGRSLSSQLLIPEPFSADKKSDIAIRLRALLGRGFKCATGERKLMVLIGEVKDMDKARVGRRLRIKHLPDFPFLIQDALHRRILTRFDAELGLWDVIPNAHLLLAATFLMDLAGVAYIEELTLVVVDHNWLVIDGMDEAVLITSLVDQNRRFIKTLRYNRPSVTPMPAGVLTDLADPVALYILPAKTDVDFQDQVARHANFCKINSWQWCVSDPMPDLP